nr:hypothetical protein [Bacteroidota bacterium]
MGFHRESNGNKLLKTFIFKYHIGFIAIIALLLFFANRNPYSPHDKMIGSDGKGYYAWLPAIFIHQDLTFGFVEEYERIHYQNTDDSFGFRRTVNNHIVNKYFPGVAILWLPFFLLAHLFCMISPFPADGYSLPYQFAIALAAIFYLWLGLKLLEKILRHFGFEKIIAAITIWIIFFGTNLYYYTIEESSFTHVYSFAAINGFVLAVLTLTGFKTLSGLNNRWVALASLLFGLIVIIRPVNGIVIFIIPLLAGSIHHMLNLVRSVFSKPGTALLAILPPLAILAIVPILWYLQTGRPVVYTYGDEHLELLKPNFFRILFSYNNGMFTYNPVLIISVIGLIPLFRKSTFAAISLTVFLIITIYIISCWTMWWYGEAYGARPFIEFYCIAGILLASLIQWTKSTGKTMLISLLTLLVVLSGFTQFRMWQYKHNIIPSKEQTSESYWSTLFANSLRAKVYLDESLVKETIRFFTDMETNPGWLNYESVHPGMAFSGTHASRIDSLSPYSIGFREPVPDFCKDGNCRVVVSAFVKTSQDNSIAQLVIDFQDQTGKSIDYHTLYLKEFIEKGKWIPVEYATPVPVDANIACYMAIYFWNPADQETVLVDDFKIEVVLLKEGN